MNTLAQLPLAAILLALPLLTAALAALLRNAAAARGVALAGAGATLAVSLLTVAAFDRVEAGLQLAFALPWIPELGAAFRLGVDGLSLLFLPTTALLFLAALVASGRQLAQARLYYCLVLALEAAILGVFLAADALFFFLCWELTVPPIYFLTALWGVGARRRHAANQYALLMLAGGAPLLFGLAIPALAMATPDFSLAALAAEPLPRAGQFLVFALLLVGFGIKAPLPPFHTWLPLLALEGPIAVVALVAGLKLGLYGLLRIAVPLAPEAAASLHWLLAGLGVVAILYGALAALTQTNLRTLLAYAGVSHVGLALLGIASYSQAGVQGALLLTLALALITGGGFLATAFLQARTGSCDCQSLGGVTQTMPRLAAFFLLCALAGLGLPGTAGFAGEWLVLLAALQSHTGAGIAALAGMVLAGAYALGAYRRAFLGPMPRAAVREACDLLPREILAATLLALPLLVFGLLPQPLLALTAASVQHWLQAVAG